MSFGIERYILFRKQKLHFEGFMDPANPLKVYECDKGLGSWGKANIPQSINDSPAMTVYNSASV